MTTPQPLCSSPPAPPQAVLDWLAQTECEAIRLEPREFYDPHIVGVAYRFGFGPVLAYDLPGILEAHVLSDGMTQAQAREYFDFNTIGGWFGEGTPVFIHRCPGSSDAPL